MEKNIKIAKELVKVAKQLIGQSTDENELITELSQLSRDFSTNNIAQIIPINFESVTVDGIDAFLNRYNAFLARKTNELQYLQNYLQDLQQCLSDARVYFEQNKQHAQSIVNQCQRLKKVLSRSQQMRTKTSPKSPSFFNR